MAAHRYVTERVGSTGVAVSTETGTTELSKSEFEKTLDDGVSILSWEALPEGATQAASGEATPAKGTAAKASASKQK